MFENTLETCYKIIILLSFSILRAVYAYYRMKNSHLIL